MRIHRPTYAEIDLDAIAHNIRAIRRFVGPGVKIMPAVKADGYGHGAVKVSQAALSAGADMLGVASVEEAVELRDHGIEAPILILGCSTPDSSAEIIARKISATVCDLASACDLAAEAAKREIKAHIHIKVDTGMGRIGCQADDAVDLVTALTGLPSLDLDGIFTHFPSADERDRRFTEEQIRIFKGILSKLNERGIVPAFAHAANSGAVIEYPNAHLDLVRPGIAMYGWYPSAEVTRCLDLKPALTFRTRIIFMKDLPPNKTISYGRTFITKRTTKVATIPVGYADGYERGLSNCGEVAVRGQSAPIIGRVCMDQTL
ncbi:MAG TPA: alanine racemase, partial [Armatimonadota bacterium]|nr:alanine racemase [Armatimonadota bacterium]